MRNIIIISVISFLIGAIFSIFVIILKIKKADEYIPFGPFIVIATIIAMLIPEDLLFTYLWMLFSGQWFIKLLKR